MTVPSRVRAPFVPAACVVFAFLLSTAPAAAQGALFGQSWVPEDLKPLMQKPFGVSFLSTSVGETLDVTSLSLVLGGQPVPPGAVSLETVTHATRIAGVSADVWLLPFVNVHGMVGHLWGSANDINPTVMPGLLPPGVTIPRDAGIHRHLLRRRRDVCDRLQADVRQLRHQLHDEQGRPAQRQRGFAGTEHPGRA